MNSAVSKWLAGFSFGLVVLIFSLLGCEHSRKTDEAAARQIDFQLMATATNCFFHEDVGGLQSLNRFIRIRVAPGDISNQVSTIIADNNQRLKRTLPYAWTQLQHPEMSLSKDKPDWWTPEKIKKGFYIGETEAYAVKIWVDMNDGTIFIHQTD